MGFSPAPPHQIIISKGHLHKYINIHMLKFAWPSGDGARDFGKLRFLPKSIARLWNTHVRETPSRRA